MPSGINMEGAKVSSLLTLAARRVESLATLVPGEPDTFRGQRAVHIAESLGRILRELPPDLRPPQVPLQMRRLRKPQTRIPAVHALVIGAANLLPLYSWNHQDEVDLEAILPQAPLIGIGHLFPTDPLHTLLHFDVISEDEEPVKPLHADPVYVPMEAYRIGEASAIYHYLRGASGTQMVLAPGMGTGKNIVSTLLSFLMHRGERANFLNIHETEPALASLSALVGSSPLPSALICNKADTVPEASQATFRQLIGRYIRKGGKVALIGGSLQTTESQTDFMMRRYGDLVKRTSLQVVPIEVKPLNLRQAHQVLTQRTTPLSADERYLYSLFVLRRTPHYLPVLRQFALREGDVTLEQAVQRFAPSYRDSIGEILGKARIWPRGTRQGRITKGKLRQIMERLDEDAQFLLDNGADVPT